MPKKTNTKKAKTVKKAKERQLQAVKYLKTPGENDKIAKQAKDIVGVLVEIKGDRESVPRSELVKALKKKLKTAQPPGRVLSFYKSALEKGRYVKFVKLSPEPSTESVTEPEPAATPAAPAPAPSAPAESAAPAETTPASA